jgi:peptide/nickel transport system substrate-binding protein
MKKIATILIILLSLLISTSGCQLNPTPAALSQTETPADSAERTLTICLGYEPESLYLYAAKSQAEWGVLEAIYDGPIDIRNYQAHPVILDSVPTLNNGKAKFVPVNVKKGDVVADVHGNPVPLESGVQVFSQGCRHLNCSVRWDGKSDLAMDQLVASYSILPGILWSDGLPLTASDSLFSFKIAGDPATTIDKRAIQQTSNYRVIDERTIEWTGIPGLLTQSLENYFWLPLPEHVLGKFQAGDLFTSEIATRKPLGWGAYVLEEWQPGEFIRLSPNPHYFRAGEGLPAFDQLIFKFINQQGDTNLMAIRKGECGLSNQTTLMMDQTERLEFYLKYYSIPEIKTIFGSGPTIEYLFFNTAISIKPNGQASTLMSDQRLRQAVAYCVDRKGLLKEFFNNLVDVPLSFLSQDHPDYSTILNAYEDDKYLSKGQRLLDEIGWLDDDKDPATARISKKIDGLPDNTPLTLQLLSDQSNWRRNVANVLSRSLQKCGIDVKFIVQKNDEYLAHGSRFWDGDFDLALFAWASGKTPPCYLFSTAAQEMLNKSITSPNLNVGKFENSEFDQLCISSLQPFVDEKTNRELQTRMQVIFNQELPALPLFPYFWADVARADFCEYNADISARSDLRDIESMNYGSQCAPKPTR